jgi:hypothetical protein
MSSATIVSSLGLVADIIGAVLIFKYGIPPRIDPQGHQHLILEQIDEQEKAKAAVFIKRSEVGVALLILGFALQLASNFM